MLILGVKWLRLQMINCISKLWYLCFKDWSDIKCEIDLFVDDNVVFKDQGYILWSAEQILDVK